MALKFRRGTTAQQSGSLAFGEPYVNSTLGTLLVGGPDGDIVLSAGGTGSTGNFGAISGSGLDITGNANIAGNLTLGGQLTIGDESADTVNVIASLSSSLIPSTTNAFDLGSASKIWRDLYISTGSIKFVAGTDVVKEFSLATLTNLEVATGSSNVSVTNLNSTTASLNTSVSNLNTATSSYETKGRGIVSGSSQITYASISSIPSGIVSGSTQVTPLLPTGVISGSSQILGGSGLVSGSSQITLSSTTEFSAYSTSVDSRITTEKGRVDAILLASDADKDSFAEIVTLINSVDTTNDAAFASFFTASTGRLNNLESTSASVNISVSNLNTFSGSALTRLSALEVETSNLESFTSSINTTIKTRLNAETVVSGSSQISLSGFSTTNLSEGTNLYYTDTRVKTKLNAETVVSGSSQITYASISSIPTGIVSGSTQITPLLPAGVVSGSSQVNADSITNFDTNVKDKLNADAVVSGSSQVQLGSASGNIALATQTTGDYVASLVAGTGVTLSNNSGENATPTITIGQVVATSSNVQFNSLGIGMAASATAGRIDATNDVVAFSSSDIRFKENIKPIENAIDKIRKISGNTYDWKEENKIEHGYEGNDVGVIAQEIEAVLPQLVQTRENGFKAVKYDKLVALLIEGIKEQQLQIEQLRIDLNNCRNKGL